MSLSNEYLAGFFDGEGSCGIYLGSQGGYRSYYAKVSIGQNGRTVLEAIQEKYHGMIHLNGPRGSRWQVDCQNATRFLRDIQPYVIEKRRIVELVLSFMDQKKDLDNDERAWFAAESHRINQLRGMPDYEPV